MFSTCESFEVEMDLLLSVARILYFLANHWTNKIAEVEISLLGAKVKQ